MSTEEVFITKQIHEQLGEPIVVNHAQETYRPAEGNDPANYPDNVLGFELNMRAEIGDSE